MLNRCALVIAAIGSCVAQSGPPTAKEIEAIQAKLTADLRGQADVQVPQPDAARTSRRRPAAGSVSVAQLRHHPPRSAQRNFARGIKLAQAGDHEKAAAEFERAIANDPDFAGAYDRLGVEFARLGRSSDAASVLTRSVALDAGSWNANYDLGVVLYQAGDFAGAERCVRRALDLAQTNPQAHLLLGLLLCSRDETRVDGVQHLQYAARSIPEANEILKRLQQQPR